MSRSENEKINEFLRKYSDLSFKHVRGAILFSKANKTPHNMMVAKICDYLLKNDIPFFTEFRMKDSKLRPDIVCPTHVKKIIEVFYSETIEDFNINKRPYYPLELQREFIFVDASKEFNERMIL
jgi:hypothetical protein